MWRPDETDWDDPTALPSKTVPIRATKKILTFICVDASLIDD
jgi:hypothetical protein